MKTKAEQPAGWFQQSRDQMGGPSGYLHPGYADSLREFGHPRELRRCGGWILERQIKGLSWKDAMGCYPLFCCQDWSQLHTEMKDLKDEFVCLSLVADPFGDYKTKDLTRCFEDLMIPLKEHFVIDLNRPRRTYVTEHHRRYARKALTLTQVENCDIPTAFADEWVKLYDILSFRHNIGGIRAFSKNSLVRQLEVPGLVMFRAIRQDATVGILLWFIQGEVGYYHLGASSPLGYSVHASFGLFWSAIDHFSERGLRWLDLGGGAGIENKGTDGLSRFKRGWSTGSRPAYFCGRIFDRKKYRDIVKAQGSEGTTYFPAYRNGEFG